MKRRWAVAQRFLYAEVSHSRNHDLLPTLTKKDTALPSFIIKGD
jgi:hypothetical protein